MNHTYLSSLYLFRILTAKLLLRSAQTNTQRERQREREREREGDALSTSTSWAIAPPPLIIQTNTWAAGTKDGHDANKRKAFQRWVAR